MHEWDEHYRNLDVPFRYGHLSYTLIADYLRDCTEVEDWGCGGGGLRAYLQDGTAYRGVDGSATPFADTIADLREYRSDAEAIVLRHVLEHNHDWRAVLSNALASFRRKLVIALFTPMGEQTKVLAVEDDFGGVPVLSFGWEDLLLAIPEALRADVVMLVDSDTHYGTETVLLIKRR
jgi:hypothetical protein